MRFFSQILREKPHQSHGGIDEVSHIVSEYFKKIMRIIPFSEISSYGSREIGLLAELSNIKLRKSSTE